MILQASQLTSLSWLEHGFGTSLSSNWPPDPSYVNLRQTHSNIVIKASQGAQGVLGEGDGLTTNQPGIWIGVRTADCAPLILADPVHRAVAAVHAGWRGTVGGIAAEAIEMMRDSFGTAPSDVVAAVGPAIAPCCFEVGAEVAQEFRPWWPERTDLDRKTMIDMPGTLFRQLIEAGLTAAKIDLSPACTHCGADRFHSFRRDREAAGRMVSAVRIRARPSSTAETRKGA